jgi:uncharacterized protein YjiS (DUF1127 family)
MDLLQHIIAWLVAWRLYRRQQKELFEFLASDHRAAADIGITPYDATRYFNGRLRPESGIQETSRGCKHALVPAQAGTQHNAGAN